MSLRDSSAPRGEEIIAPIRVRTSSAGNRAAAPRPPRRWKTAAALLLTAALTAAGIWWIRDDPGGPVSRWFAFVMISVAAFLPGAMGAAAFLSVPWWLRRRLPKHVASVEDLGVAVLGLNRDRYVHEHGDRESVPHDLAAVERECARIGSDPRAGRVRCGHAGKQRRRPVEPVEPARQQILESTGIRSSSPYLPKWTAVGSHYTANLSGSA